MKTVWYYDNDGNECVWKRCINWRWANAELNYLQDRGYVAWVETA